MQATITVTDGEAAALPPTPTTAPTQTPTAAPTAMATAEPTATTPAATATPTATAEPTATTAPPESSSETVTSNIANFSLQDLTVSVGAAIEWSNKDGPPHTVTSGDSPDPSGVWDSGSLSTDDTFKFTFAEAGTFNYFCTIHPNMQATVTVTGAEETAAEPELVASNIANFILQDLTVSVGAAIEWTKQGVESQEVV